MHLWVAIQNLCKQQTEPPNQPLLRKRNDPQRTEWTKTNRSHPACSQSSCGFCWNGAPWHGPWHGPWGLSLIMSHISRQHTATLDRHAACWHSASCDFWHQIYKIYMQSATEMPEKLLIHWHSIHPEPNNQRISEESRKGLKHSETSPSRFKWDISPWSFFQAAVD